MANTENACAHAAARASLPLLIARSYLREVKRINRENVNVGDVDAGVVGEEESGIVAQLKSAHKVFPLPIDSCFFFVSFMSGKFMRKTMSSARANVKKLNDVVEKLEKEGVINNLDKNRLTTISNKKKN